MSEKQKQSESYLMINDISQHSVASWFRCGGAFDQYCETNLLLRLFRKNF